MAGCRLFSFILSVTLTFAISTDSAGQVLAPEGYCPGLYSATNENADTRCSSTLQSKLDATGSWCQSEAIIRNTTWLQIDLGSVQTVLSITTQGRGNPGIPQWVTSYRVLYSTDGENVTDAGSFNGNSDQNTKITNNFAGGIVARYLRINPLKFYGHPSMRVCVTTATPTPPPPPVPTLVLDGTTCRGLYSASTQAAPPTVCDPETAQINKTTGAWCAASPGVLTDYLQIDLRASYTLTAVYIQGRPEGQWVTSFFVKVSDDGINYRQVGGLYDGNNDVATVVGNCLEGQGRYVRIYPVGYYAWTSLRACVKTDTAPPPMADASVGLYSVSREHPSDLCDVTYAKLKSKGAWCALSAVDNTNTDQWLQIDLGSPQNITSVTTQGRYNVGQWVTWYTLSGSLNGHDLTYLGIFKGNTDQNSYVSHDLYDPVDGTIYGVWARYLRVTPVEFYGHPSMRVGVETASPTIVPPRPFLFPGGGKVNLALNRTVSATCTGTTSCSLSNLPVNFAVDGDLKTRWNPSGPATASTPIYLQIDLGSSQSFNTIRIYWENNHATNYTIEGSNDGTTWALFITKTDGSATSVNPIDEFTKLTLTYRYIRIGIRDGYCCSGTRTYTGSIYEVQIEQDQGSCSCNGIYSATTRGGGCGIENAQINKTGGWCANRGDNPTFSEFLQIDLGSLQNIIAVFTQGRSDAGQWVYSYFVNVSIDGVAQQQVGGLYDGNFDMNTIVGNNLEGYGRYVRIIPVGIYGWVSMRVCIQTAGVPPPIIAPTFTADAMTCQGIYSATAEHPTCDIQKSRINNASGWCALTPGILTDFLQIDLGSKLPLSAFFIQGRADYGQWIQSFYLFISDDGYTLQQIGGLYNGNNNQTGIQGYNFDVGVAARYVRIYPYGWYGHTSLRTCVRTAVIPPPIVRPTFVAGGNTCPGLYSAYTENPTCDTQRARINNASGWCGLTAGVLTDFLQIDLQSKQTIKNFYIQGRGDYNQFVTSFYLFISDDGYTLKQIGGLWKGPNDHTTILGYQLDACQARYLRIYPVGWQGHTSLRTCVETVDYTPAIPAPKFVAGPNVCKGLISVSTVNPTCDWDHVTINNNTGWCAGTPGDLRDYLQIDLGSVQTLANFFLQARPCCGQWVTSFYLFTSIDGYTLQQLGGLFEGSFDQTTITGYALDSRQARYVRIYPKGYQGYTSLRACVQTVDTPPAIVRPQFVAGNRTCQGIYAGSTEAPSCSDEIATINNVKTDGAWCAYTASLDITDFLQIDLGTEQDLKALYIQGRGCCSQWVTSFYLFLSGNGHDLAQVGGLWGASGDMPTIGGYSLVGYKARFLRIQPVGFINYKSLRACVETVNVIPTIVSPQYETPVDLTGWTLVRRVKAGATWHPTTDSALGTQAAYGTPTTDPTAAVTFSLKYDQMDWDEMLFATGDGLKWIIVKKAQVALKGGDNFLANISSSHLKDIPYQARWYNRVANVEDPWLSARDHAWMGYSAGNDVEEHSMLYGENSFNGWNYWIKNHNGANVFVRKSSGAPAPTASATCPGVYTANTAHSNEAYCDIAISQIDTHPGGYCAKNLNDNTSFVQIDLGNSYDLTGIFFQPRSDNAYWVTSFYVATSDDGYTLTPVGGLIPGNNNAGRVKTVSYSLAGINARFIRIYPIGYQGWKAFRACVRTATRVPPPPTLPPPPKNGTNYICPGIYSTMSQNPDGGCDASQAILGWTGGAYCPLTGTTGDNIYLQIDLPVISKITSISTQGRNAVAQWVVSYSIKYSTIISNNNNDYKPYGGLFLGNTDWSTIQTNALALNARSIRIYPQAWINYPSIRACLTLG